MERMFIVGLMSLGILNYSWGQSIDLYSAKVNSQFETRDQLRQKDTKSTNILVSKHGPRLKIKSEQSLKNLDFENRGVNLRNGGVVNGGGGDDVALDFIKTATIAIQEMNVTTSEKTELLAVIKRTKFYVTDQQLPVIIPVSSTKSQFQYSTAVNDPSSNSIYIQRTRWVRIESNEIRKELARHEILSLAGLERTGHYQISSSTNDISDVIVQPPKFEASVTLTGKPSELQLNEYRVYKLQFDNNGQYLVNSIDDIRGRNLGETTPVDGGRYGIWFSGMYLMASVKKGENYQYTVKYVQLPLSNGFISFRILHDLNNPIEQEKSVVSLWTQNDAMKCDRPEKSLEMYCSLKAKNNFAEFRQYMISTVLANNCGADPICNYSGFRSIRSVVLAKGDADHDRVALLPGAYIAEFVNKYGDKLNQNFIVSQ